MPGFIPTAFEFVPVGIFSAIFFIMVLYVKYVNQLNLRSVGSDICLGALFIQITLLAVPVWMGREMPINIAVHAAAVILTLITWIITVWLLKRRKPSRARSTKLSRKIIDYLNKQSNIRESMSYVLGAFALSVSLMMMLDVIDFNPAHWRVQTTQLVLAALTSVAIGYGGYSIYRYLQNEQYNQRFERFSREITRDNVLMTVQLSGTQMHECDPVQPVVDIIRGSIMKGVLGPSLFGLQILNDNCIALLTTSGMRQQSLNRITSYFIGHIDEIGKLALRMDEDEAAIESIKSMGKIGECAVSKGFETPVKDILRRLSEYHEVLHSGEFEIMKLAVTDAIDRIGAAAAHHGNESVSSKASNLLGIIGASAVRDNDKSTLKETITALYTIGKESAINSLENSVKQTAVKLRDIGISAVQTGMTDEGLQIMTHLEKLGVAAASSKLELGTEQVIWSVKDIGVAYGYQRIEKGINAAVDALSSVGLESSLRKLDDAVDQALWSLKEVSRYPISEGLKDSIKKSAQSFARMAESEQDKVERMIQDIRQHYGSDEAKQFKKFEQEYLSTRKTGAD